MKQQHQAKRKKKKRNASRAARSEKRDEEHQNRLIGDDEERKIIGALKEAFDSVSLDEVSAAFKEANGNLDKAAEILRENSEDLSTSCSVSSGPWSSESGSGSSGSTTGSEGFLVEGDLVSKKAFRQKRAVAVTGTVSTVLGKDYVKAASPRRGSAKEASDFCERKEEAEQFLCSMLGDDCELGMAVVRDVLCE